MLYNEQKQWAKDNDRQLYSMWQMYSVNLAVYVLGHWNNLIVELPHYNLWQRIHTIHWTINYCDCIIIYTVLQSVWEHVGCVNRPISGSANTRSCHVLLRIDKLLQHVSSLLVSSTWAAVNIANNLIMQTINFTTQLLCQWQSINNCQFRTWKFFCDLYNLLHYLQMLLQYIFAYFVTH